MKQKIKILATLFLMISLGFAAYISQPNLAVADTGSSTSSQVNPAATGLVPCGGNEQQAAQQLLQNPSQANVQNWQNNSCQFSDLFKMIARITNILVGFAGIYAIFLIVIAGFRMVAAAGNSEMLQAGKDGLSNAVIGFILVMIAYALVNTIFELFKVKLTGQSSGFLYNPFTGK